MSDIKFNGNPIHVSGDILGVGESMEDFTFVKEDLSEGNLADYSDQVKVVMAVPSLDTGICQKEARAFNEMIGKMEGVVGLTVSKDLPFAMKRFCSSEGIEDIISASDFRYNDFGSQNGLEMTDGPLKGLFARVVFVLDKDNKIAYKEEVDDIVHEPNYEAAVAAVKELV